MTAVGVERERPGPGSAPRQLARVAASAREPERAATRLDFVVLGVVAFILEYDLPQMWFTSPDRIAQNRASLGEGQTAALLVVAFVYALFTSGFDIGSMLRHIRHEWLLPALVGLMLVSSLWSVHPFQSFRDGAALAVCVLLAYWAYDRMSVRQILGVLGWVFGLGAVLSALMIKVLPQFSASGLGWTGLLKNRNQFGQSVVLGFMVLLLCARLHPRWRLPAYGLAALSVLLVLGSNSKTSLVALITMPVMLATFTVFRARRTLYAAVSIVMGFGAVGTYVVATRLLPSITQALDRQTNLSGRTDIWSDIVDLLRSRPWFGYGFHGFWSDPFGVARTLTIQYGALPHAHNALLETAVNMGIVGAALLVALFVRLLVRGARVVRYLSGTAGLFPLGYAGYALLVSITEVGVLERSLKFLMLALAVTAAARGRRDALEFARSSDRPGRSTGAVRG